MKSKRLFLIDGSAMMFRSFHAFSGRGAQLTSRGMDVGMSYGFMLTLISLLRREKPDGLAIAFDTGAPTFRHKLSPEYKANRPPMDESMRVQLPLMHELIDLFKIPQLSVEGWEADDVIGTLAKRGAAEGLEVFLVTGDKDFYQLVNERVKVYTLPRNTGDAPHIYDPAGVREKFGVPPERVIDVLALWGDTSDNVPGVPGVGQKRAVELVGQFGELEAVLQGASSLKPSKMRDNLIEFADLARSSLKLVIIDTDMALDLKPDELTYGPLNNPDARSRLAELEFNSLLAQLDQLEPGAAVVAEEKLAYKSVTTPAELDAMIVELEKAKLLSIDVETTSLDAMRAELVGMSFSIEEKQGWFVSVNYFRNVPPPYPPPGTGGGSINANPGTGGGSINANPGAGGANRGDGADQMQTRFALRPDTSSELAYILSKLRPIYEDDHILKTGQNLKYDSLVLACYDIEVRGIQFDTLIAAHLLDPSARQLNIDILAQNYLNYRKIPTTQLIGSGAKQKSMLDVPLEEIVEYAVEDADIALRLTNLFKPRLTDAGQDRIYYEQELPLLPVLLRMEKTGVKIDADILGRMSVEFQGEMDVLEEEIHDIAGMKFNLNSTQQLAEILFDKLQLPRGKKTKTGYSTDASELERLAPVHPLPRKLLRYRHLSKLKSTYIDALPQMIHPLTGRVHTSYSQTIAATGRLSSTDPNLQNIPIRTEEGGAIRKAFIAGDDELPPRLRGGSRGGEWLIVSADYSQIELRIMAHLSGDELLLQAFKEGQDIHRATAAWMFDSPPELVTSDMRRHAKEVNFGVLYGMGDFGLAQRLGISRARAREFIDQYFGRFARVREYIDELHERTRKLEYVETIMGRRRPLPDINAKNFQVRQNAQRIAINTPIQGSAADLMKLAMIKVDAMLREEGFQARMLLQVHDELVFEAPQEELDKLAKRLKEVMADAMKLSVPMVVEVSWGRNWLEAHE